MSGSQRNPLNLYLSSNEKDIIVFLFEIVGLMLHLSTGHFHIEITIENDPLLARKTWISSLSLPRLYYGSIT